MKNKKNSEWTANRFGCPLLVLAAGSFWGLMGLLVRSLNEEGLSSMEICFVRAVITLVCMLAGLLLLDRKALKIRLKDIWCFVGTGALSVTFFNFCYFKTMTLTSLSVAAILLYTAPAFVMLMFGGTVWRKTDHAEGNGAFSCLCGLLLCLRNCRRSRNTVT